VNSEDLKKKLEAWTGVLAEQWCHESETKDKHGRVVRVFRDMDRMHAVSVTEWSPAHQEGSWTEQNKPWDKHMSWGEDAPTHEIPHLQRRLDEAEALGFSKQGAKRVIEYFTVPMSVGFPGVPREEARDVAHCFQFFFVDSYRSATHTSDEDNEDNEDKQINPHIRVDGCTFYMECRLPGLGLSETSGSHIEGLLQDVWPPDFCNELSEQWFEIREKPPITLKEFVRQMQDLGFHHDVEQCYLGRHLRGSPKSRRAN
jgi:hypothetical protein